MQLQLQTFSTLVGNAVAAVQGSARQFLDLTVGSVLRAVLEANASVALWLQWLILQVLRTTRAATSQGPDLDTWVADFGVMRLPAVAAAGQVTFSRFVALSQATIPSGATVRTGDGSQTFVVVPDPANAAWSTAQNGFVLPAGTASISLRVSAVVAGQGGNVQGGAVALLGTAVPGVDTVSNAAAMQGGVDAETDAALRTRFGNFLASRARATPIAVSYAISSVRQGLLFNIVENQTPDGSPRPGYFTVTVDDGTGYPGSALLTSVSQAVDAMRPICSLFTVQAPTVWTVNISLAIATAGGTDHAAAAASVAAVLTGFLNSFALGAPLTWSRIVQVAYSADARVINVTQLLLNGGTSDLIPPSNVVLKAGNIQVT